MVSAIVCGALSVAVIAVAAARQQRRHGAGEARNRIAVLLVSASQAAIALFVIVGAFHAGLPFLAPIVLVASIACAVTDDALFAAIARSGERARDAQRRRLLEETERAEADYREKTLLAEKSASNERDVMLQEIRAVISALEEGRESKAEALLDGIASAGKDRILCSNKAVDALLREKTKDAERRGIAAMVDVDVPEGLPIPTVDLCALFANLMDNALSGCEQVEEASLSLRAGVRGAFFVVEARNDCDPEVAMAGVQNSASLGDEHGWGLGIVGDIASRHGGISESAVEGDQFSTTVLLSLANVR